MKDRTQAGWDIASTYRVTQGGLSDFILRGAGARDRRFQVPRRVSRALEHRLEDKKLVQPSRGGGEAHCSGREQGQHRDTRRRRENNGNTEIQGGREKTTATQRYKEAERKQRQHRDTRRRKENNGSTEIQGGREKLCLPNARDSAAFAEPRGEGVSWALQ